MGKVTVHNYSFPIEFIHKGWKVKISEETSFFSMKDLRINAKIEIPTERYANFIATKYAERKEMIDILKRKKTHLLHSTNEPTIKQKEYNEAYDYYLKVAKEYAAKRGTIQKSFGMNGGLIDRFLGQNISATEKALQLVIDYVDNNLGDAWDDFIKSVK